MSRRGHDLLGGSAGTGGDIAQLSLAGAQLASADPTAEMLASAAAAAAAADGAEEAANAAIKLPYGYGLHFAGDFAWTKTDQAGAIGEDEADVQALTAGIDYNDGKGSVMGAALSYLTAEVDQTYGFGGQTDSDGYALSAFGATQMGNMSADVYASFGWLAYDTTRRLLVAPATFANAIGETNSMQTQAGANFTAELACLSSLRMSAIGGVHYIGLSIDGYTETGAGALSAVLPDREIESLKTLSWRYNSISASRQRPHRAVLPRPMGSRVQRRWSGDLGRILGRTDGELHLARPRTRRRLGGARRRLLRPLDARERTSTSATKATSDATAKTTMASRPPPASPSDRSRSSTNTKAGAQTAGLFFRCGPRRRCPATIAKTNRRLSWV